MTLQKQLTHLLQWEVHFDVDSLLCGLVLMFTIKNLSLVSFCY